MPEITINNFNVTSKVSAYNITKQDITRTFEAENGDTISYPVRRENFTIDLEIVCDGDFYSHLDSILSDDEFETIFTYAGSEHTAIMMKKSYKASCETLAGKELWTVSLSLTECRRA